MPVALLRRVRRGDLGTVAHDLLIERVFGQPPRLHDRIVGHTRIRIDDDPLADDVRNHVQIRNPPFEIPHVGDLQIPPVFLQQLNVILERERIVRIHDRRQSVLLGRLLRGSEADQRTEERNADLHFGQEPDPFPQELRVRLFRRQGRVRRYGRPVILRLQQRFARLDEVDFAE